MQFNSYSFFVFLILVFFLYKLFSNDTSKKALLLCASYIFCGWINPLFVMILMAYTLINFLFAKLIIRSSGTGNRLALYTVALFLDIGFLITLKYANFFAESFLGLVRCLGLDFRYSHTSWNILLPIGISFFTFSAVSYLIDIYRGDLKETGSALDFSLYIAFFPKLVSGPIVRAKDFLPQLKEKRLAIDSSLLYWGIFLCSWGLFKKVVIADNMSIFVDSIFSQPSKAGMINSWIAAYGYSIQLYCDFGGYSDIAIGLALVFGFHFRDNFNRPYGALGFSDFWQRWHISLSTWLRDYLYIPLGGNRKGSLRTYMNIMTTMLVCGLWHGAQWTFVVWGAIHGLYLSSERFINEKIGASRTKANRLRMVYQVVLWGMVFHFVSMAWIFFRAESLSDACLLFKNMFYGRGVPLWSSGFLPRATFTTLVTLTIICWHLLNRNHPLEHLAKTLPDWSLGVVAGLLFLSCAIFGAPTREFIYFQF